jgi:hypothetical protein
MRKYKNQMNSGYYPKVIHPNAILPQMKSSSFQAPFYFGGSQVPVNLATLKKGIHKKSKK